MAVKSVVQIDIDQTAFKQYLDLFGKYQAALQKMPAHWKNAAGQAATIAKANQGIVAAMLTQQQIMGRMQSVQQAMAAQANQAASAWGRMAQFTKSAATSIESATRSLLRWSGFTGLLGIGGLFGLDALASSVARTRQFASGINAPVGEVGAFGVNYGRFVSNPEGVLGNVSAALHDPRAPGYPGLVYALRGNPGTDPVQATRRLLQALPGLFPGGPNDQFLGTHADALGLSSLLPTSDIIKYLSAKPAERGEVERGFIEGTKKYDLSDKTTKSYQDLDTVLQDAKTSIWTVFVKGLEPLAGPLGELSNSVTGVVAAFLKAANDKHWIEQISESLEKFATYLGTPEFDDSVKKFAEDIGTLASLLGQAVTWIAGAFGSDRAKERANDTHAYGLKTPSELRQERAGGKSIWSQIFEGPWENKGRHNPGGMRLPGQSTGFASFPSDEAGISAIARQLLIYQGRDSIDTISGIINKYAPANENDTAAYIRDVSR
ncbi:MAG: hypothetical protein WAN65_30395, partial [Candidatus Sulfotelmatobacter sp.]